MGGNSSTRTIVGEWDYLDKTGQVVYTKIKYEPKSFAWKTPRGFGLNGIDRVPYNLPEVLNAKSRWIFLCEGEKDCSTLAKAGFIATTFGGASDLPKEALEYFRGCKVFIVGDFDKAGANRVESTYHALQDIAEQVAHVWLRSPDQSEAINDITDWFLQGGTPDKLREQVKGADGFETLPQTPTHQFLTYEDILQLPPAKWLVYDFLLENSTAMLWGASGSYKSFTALDLSLSVATGQEYHGNKTQPADVIYLAGEGGMGYRTRIGAWQEHYQAKIDRFYLLPVALDLLQPEAIDIILEDINILKINLGLFVIDTLARCNTGDENDAGVMSQYINNLDRIRNATGCTILLVHHSGKNASSGARGSSAIYAAMDTSIEVAKQETTCTITCDKQKDSPYFEQRQFEMKTVNFLDGESLVPVLDENPTDYSVDEDVIGRLQELLNKEGEARKHKDIPEHQLVLNRSRLREVCLDLFEGTSNTKGKAFGRSIERLIATNRIAFTGSARSVQYLWVLNENQIEENQFK